MHKRLYIVFDWILFVFLIVCEGDVDANPVLTLSSVIVPPGNTVTLTCVYTPGTAPQVFVWVKDGSVFYTPWGGSCVELDATPAGYSGDTCTPGPPYAFTLTTPALTTNDNGQQWQCEVNDGTENTLQSSIMQVTVEHKASVAKFALKNHPGTNITVEETDTYTFECSATGNPAATVTITKDTHTVVAQSNSTGHVEYLIHNATCEDSGIYTCTAYNKYNNGGHATTHAIQLNVLCAPSPKYDVEANIIVYKALHDPLVLNLTIISYPQLTKYTWSKLHGNKWTTLISTEPER